MERILDIITSTEKEVTRVEKKKTLRYLKFKSFKKLHTTNVTSAIET